MLRLLALLIIQAVCFSSCAKSSPAPVILDLPRPSYSDEEILDVSLTICVLNPARRRRLLSSDDPVAWVNDYWERNDPSPDTPENETLQVFRQRAEYLASKFPDTYLYEVPEPWRSFFMNGFWDWIQSGALSFRLQNVDLLRGTSRLTPYADSVMVATDALQYNTPNSFEVILSGDRVLLGRDTPQIPSLRRVWRDLENPRASERRKINALQKVAWFETATFAKRLLELPDSVIADVSSELEDCLRRMAIRRSYCIGSNGARRLAAITAAGASPRLQLSRTLEATYSEDQYRADITELLKIQKIDDHPFKHGPHPLLRFKPETILTELADRFSTTKSITGWDWVGDLHLAFGPPHYCHWESHIARYVYEYPSSYGIRAGMLGDVDVVRIDSGTSWYFDHLYNQIERKNTQAQTTIDELLEKIPEASTVSPALLQHLHNFVPLSPLYVGDWLLDHSLDLSADVIVFPDSIDSVELILNMGVPFNELHTIKAGSEYQTLLETSCCLLSTPYNLVWWDKHDDGFSLAEPEGTTEFLHLVDTYRSRTDLRDYILYCSALDPITEKSAGRLFYLELESRGSSGPILSPVALAGEVKEGESGGALRRGDYSIVPYPGRRLLYGEDIWLYFEIRNLERSEYGDSAWEESYFFIPDRKDMGVVQVSSGLTHNSIQSQIHRTFMIDLSSMEEEYTGPIFIVVLVKDVVSGQSAITAARFTITRR